MKGAGAKQGTMTWSNVARVTGSSFAGLMWAALALFGVGLLILHFPDRVGLGWGAWLFVAGIALFSGSLYALALTGVRYFGAITPVGGVAFLAGWLVIAWTVARA